MKKVLSALFAVAAIHSPLAIAAIRPPATVHGPGGTINFSGAVIATTCTVTNGGATALIVRLPAVGALALSPTAGRTNFALNISGCTAETKATAYFDGGAINAMTGRLSNTTESASGPANVELQLLNVDDGAVIDLAGPSGGQRVSPAIIASGAATANFAVEYYHTDANPITPGLVTSNVTYSMDYN